MIENFEEITAELTAEEQELLPALIAGFRRHDETDPIKGSQIVIQMNIWLEMNGKKGNFSEARLRKFVNHIRSNALLPLIATSKGYFCSEDTDVLHSQIRRLQQRARSILNCADGLEYYLMLND